METNPTQNGDGTQNCKPAGATGYCVGVPDFSGEVELSDGETATFARPDEVFPTVSELVASADLYIEDGRFRVREESECVLSVAVANKEIGRPDGALATLHAGISKGQNEDKVYTEIALEDAEAIRQLRDALTLALRYRGDNDGD